MIIQTVLKNHIKFLNDTHEQLEVIHTAIASNKEISQLLSSGFQRLKEKDRKTVSKVMLTELVSAIGYTEATVVDLVAQLHYTSVMGIVSTTESDVYDIVYTMDIPTMIERMKRRYTELAAMLA